MPKRWRVMSGSGWGYDLLDAEGTVVYSSPRTWDSEEAVDDELGEIEDGDIEFPGNRVEPPRHRRGKNRP